MTNAYVNGSSQQVVKASIPADSTGILFHNNGGTQTVNIESGIANNKGYYLNGEWEGGHAKVGSWDVAFYTISYNANGGTGTMANDNAVCDVGWGLKANTFTRSGYVFTGWNTAADGSGISYSDQQLVPANTKVDGDTLTLYAQWQDVSHIYFIYFSKNSDYYSGFHDGLYIHYWGGSHGTDWPGVAVATFAYTDTYGNDVYVVQVPDDVTGMLFHNGSGTQTVDITSGIGNNKGFYLNGEWQDGKAKVGSWNVVLP